MRLPLTAASPQSGARAWPGLAAVCALLLAATLGVMLALEPVGSALSGLPLSQLMSRLAGSIQVKEPGYQLAIDRTNGILSVQAPDGRPYTTLPLTALAGLAGLPKRAERAFHRTDRGFVEELKAPGGGLLETVSLTPRPDNFTVTFSSRVGTDTTSVPRFFFDGSHGIGLQSIEGGFTPNAPAGQVPFPAVFSTPRTALSPPPLDLQLETAAGWLGVGLVQVPNATSLKLLTDGALAMDYPLDLLNRNPDHGGGGRVGPMVRFPAFVFTFGGSSFDGLRAYGQALVQLGQAPAGPAARPSWWQQPIVDTWGAQMAEHAARGSQLFTSAWVQDFATTSQRRLGLTHLTIVIDSRWQDITGQATPDPVRFGGWAGMRALIDHLHAEGFRVVLWWPLWVDGLPGVPPTMKEVRLAERTQLVDPTVAGFQNSMAATVRELLGSGPGDLNADGLKLDWAYDMPARFEDPSLGWGDAALYRYLSVIHAAAHAVRPDALVEASAAAPQFARVTDAVRLYDAWTEADWDARAAVVSAADPTALIDGDGWAASAANALPHAVSSTVYGVPAFYFGNTWADGAPISPELSRELGQVMALAPQKGNGSARLLGDGEWAWVVRGKVQAQTFDGQRDLVLWSKTCGRTQLGTVVATSTGTVLVPVPSPQRAQLLGARGAVPVTPAGGGISAQLVAGTRYQVQIGSRCQITPLARRSSRSRSSSA